MLDIMVKVAFTSNLLRHLSCPEQRVEGRTVAEALQQVLTANPRLSGYLLDDQTRLRKHIAIFVDGQMIRDRQHLSDPLHADSEVYVMQALSGG